LILDFYWQLLIRVIKLNLEDRSKSVKATYFCSISLFQNRRRIHLVDIDIQVWDAKFCTVDKLVKFELSLQCEPLYFLVRAFNILTAISRSKTDVLFLRVLGCYHVLIGKHFISKHYQRGCLHVHVHYKKLTHFRSRFSFKQICYVFSFRKKLFEMYT